MFHPQKHELMKRLSLDQHSRILLISTEGDTDVQHYREVVWEGKHSISGCTNQEHRHD
jgi:diaminopropionate ammonia-lyase